MKEQASQHRLWDMSAVAVGLATRAGSLATHRVVAPRRLGLLALKILAYVPTITEV